MNVGKSKVMRYYIAQLKIKASVIVSGREMMAAHGFMYRAGDDNSEAE